MGLCARKAGISLVFTQIQILLPSQTLDQVVRSTYRVMLSVMSLWARNRTNIAPALESTV